MSPPVALAPIPSASSTDSQIAATSAARPLWRTPPAPFVDRDDHIRERLCAVRARVRTAIDHVQERARDERVALKIPANVRGAETLVAAREDATRGSLEIPAIRLRERLELSASEDLILWTLLANEMCASTRRMLRLLATEEVTDPTTDVIRRVVYADGYSPDAWRELSPTGTLRRLGLLERTDAAPETPEHRQTWRIARRTLALVHGVTAVDDGLTHLAEWESLRAGTVEDLVIDAAAVQRARAGFDSSGCLLVTGRPGQGRSALLHALAGERGLQILTVRGRELATDRTVATRQLQAVRRECLLLGLVPLVRDVDALAAHGDAKDRLDLLDRELPGLVLATAREPVARAWARTPTVVELPPATSGQLTALWKRALPAATDDDAAYLATLYPLAPASLVAAAKAAVEVCGDEHMTPTHVAEGIRTVLDSQLGAFATRLTIAQTWDDLVLPEDQLASVIELLARVRERHRVYESWGFGRKVGKGLGVAGLLSGPPGTGKTMVAGLIAHALNTEIYQVDLSKIVSKWIGETEKNLGALFDAAEAGHAILLFDEADALFGKRTDVKSSNDRHANQEVNFLLQRLESFSGICLLTTNHVTSIDEAFRRRLSTHIRFETPDVEERRRLWRALLPSAAPTDGDLELDDLAATFTMTGGYIKNAVLRAAFMAADERSPITATHLRQATHLEYEAMGRLAPYTRGSHVS